MAKTVKRVHFMGIGGSGMSAVAQIAHAQGYKISGCDLNLETPYISKIQRLTPNIYHGHSANHLKDIDILAVTPAVFYQSQIHPEVKEAKKRNVIMKWQEFMGKYLHQNKFLICIAGTHGKSTTTAWAGHLLENADLDPTAEIGATDNIWHNNVRIGNGKYFVSEADEFHDNFAAYHPDIIILNNIEMDHPEYFLTLENMLETFKKFVYRLTPNGTLIYNSNSTQVLNLIHSLDRKPHLIPYNFSECQKVHVSPSGSSFTYLGQTYIIALPGYHNIENSLGIIELAKVLKLSPIVTQKTLKTFAGVGRRIELIGKKNGIKVYDDYANHPTAYKATIQTVKILNPDSRIWAIIEPHTYSRLRAVLTDLPRAVSIADRIIVSDIFPSRETDPGDFSSADIVTAMHHPHARYIPEFDHISTTLKKGAQPGDVILVMGSGNSHKLSRQILDNL